MQLTVDTACPGQSKTGISIPQQMMTLWGKNRFDSFKLKGERLPFEFQCNPHLSLTICISPHLFTLQNSSHKIRGNFSREKKVNI